MRERLQRGLAPMEACEELCDHCLAPNTNGCGKGASGRSVCLSAAGCSAASPLESWPLHPTCAACTACTRGTPVRSRGCQLMSHGSRPPFNMIWAPTQHGDYTFDTERAVCSTKWRPLLAGLMSIRGPGGVSDRVRNPVGRRRVRRRAAAGCAGAGCDNMSAMVVLLKAFAPDLAAAQAKAAAPLPAP